MSNEKTEYTLVPQDGELQPVGKIPTVTPEQVNVLAVIQSVSKVEVLANVEETAAGIVQMKASYLPIVEKATRGLSAVKTKADLDRVKRTRLDIAKERIDFVDVINTELSVRRELIKNAVKGRDTVEETFKSIESEIYAIEKPIEDAFKAAAAAKKAVADAIAKLKSHAINQLLPAADIETAIDDFRLSFGDTDYQESQSVAESIFEAKITEFDVILAAAQVREENEERVRIGMAKDQQRANINVTFPIVDISYYAARSSVDIQSRIDLMINVDMTAFDLVLTEAEIAKQSCLNMLNAFLSIAVAREVKEAADKAVSERLEREKQAEIDAKAAKEAAEKQYQDDWGLAIFQYANWIAIKANERSLALDAESECELIRNDVETESAIIAIINNDAEFVEDVAKIINGVHFDDAEPIEVSNEVNEDDCVLIPVRYLISLLYAAEEAAEHCGLDEDDDLIAAIEFVNSLL